MTAARLGMSRTPRLLYSFPAHAQTLKAESVVDVSRREVGAPLSQPDWSEAETEVVVGHLVIDCVVGHGRPGSGDSEVGIQVIANAHVVPLSILHYAQHDDVRGRERSSQERFRNASGVLDSGERVLVLWELSILEDPEVYRASKRQRDRPRQREPGLEQLGVEAWVVVNDWHESRDEGRLLRIQAVGEPGQSDKRPKVVSV